MTAYRVSEAQTRYNLIDPQLKKAEWNLSDRTQVGLEIPVSGYDANPYEGVTDYCLYRSNGEVLAVVEAKRTTRDARVGKQQVLEYVEAIEKKQSFRPYAFMANGDDVFFWDTEESAERHVAGFFSRENLERLLFLKQNHLPLSSIKIKESIVNRSYQIEAIRRISEAIEKKKKRKALLVMATGTGKTRTIMALIDVFLRAHVAQRVLFLADRDQLVEQAKSEGFKIHLPNESLERVWTPTVEEAKRSRLLVSTIQTMAECREKFSPSDFDLIISDECHRSIYNKFTDVLAYFDAVQIGLTATPAGLVDRDTFRFFDCDPADGGTGGRVPTFNYPFEVAVEEKYLVNFDAYAAQTKFQRKGIKGVDLTEEEKESLRERGIDPEDVNYEGTDLERKVTNKDTLRRQWEEFMDVCLKDAAGQLPGKTIVFAITHQHALRLEETFNEMYPEYGGRLVQVITSKMERPRSLIRKFKTEDFPRIAISVDMLDTGFDFPEVVNLAFMKPVNSQIKFWQMIGRGTRNHETCTRYEWLPNRIKERFLIVDFWENFEHFNMMTKETEGEGSGQIPILVTIFNTQLRKLETLFGQDSSLRTTQPNVIASPAEGGAWQSDSTQNDQIASLPTVARNDILRIVRDLRAMIARIPRDSFSVKKVWKEVQQAWQDDFWRHVSAREIEFLRLKVAPLLRFVPDVQMDAEFFVSKMERCGLAFLQNKELKTPIESIQEDVKLLPTNLSQVAAHRRHIDAVLSIDFWQTFTLAPKNSGLAKLDETKEALAPLMKYKQERPSIVIELGLDDIIDSRKWVVLRKDSQRMYVEEYRIKVEAKIVQLANSHPTIGKLKKGEEVNVEDFVRLEETLEAELGSDELSLDDENMLKAFGVRVGSFVDFLKHVLKIETMPSYETIVRKAFDTFILEHNYNADQSRFLRVVQSVFLQRRKLEVADLYEEPFTSFGLNAVDKLFSEAELEELVSLARRLAD